MRTISVSEVQSYQLCKLKHHFQYERRLAPLARDPRMASGTVVHEMVADLLTQKEGKSAAELLTEQFPGDPYGDEKVAKYLNGVHHAVEQLNVGEGGLRPGPEWVSEELFNYKLTDEVVITMKPDLYTVSDEVIELVEIKTTDRNPLDYLLFNPQHEWYGLGLLNRFPGRIVTFQYRCLPTRGKAPIPAMPWVFSQRRMDESRTELVEAVDEMSQGFKPRANRGWWCNNCNFKDICVARVAGGDVEGVMSNSYKEREMHESTMGSS